MGSQQTIKPTSTFTYVPPYYPTVPTPGKLQLLWDVNHRSLYNRLSPYTDYNNTLISGITKEPFYWVTPEDGNKGLPGLRKYESRSMPIGSGPIDVIRVSKFLGSGRGIKFLATQFLLQTGNAFNETRIYNPSSPILAASTAFTLGAIRPQRNFDTSAGLLGIASTLFGSAIPNAIFGTPKVNPPSGTARDPLSTTMTGVGGKGLIRAGTAERAKSHLEAAWQPPGKFKFSVGGLIKGLFQNFIPQTQPGIIHRSDEGAYGLMIGSGFQSKKFMYHSVLGDEIHFHQQWIAGGEIMRKTNEDVPYPYYYVTGPNGKILPTDIGGGRPVAFSGTSITVGFEYGGTKNTAKVGVRYGDTIGVNIDPVFKASQMMVQYSKYINPALKYPTKKTTTPADATTSRQNEKLQAVIAGLKSVVYTVNVPNDARVISSGYSTVVGYDRLFATRTKFDTSPLQYALGVMKDYENSRVVDDTLKGTGNKKSLRLPAKGKFDAINTLKVLDKGKFGKDPKLRMKGWGTEEWNQYEHDQIAFFFYDIINEKYIPFRAAINNLAENSNASWDELAFIGRADKVYSYGGFTRGLSLGFKIVISSIAELAPTWQRINYLTTLVKPANYTRSTPTENTPDVPMNQFMVPPMILLTIGDMYKDQPVLFQTITTTIPPDATWETLNKENMPGGWEYLANYMKAPGMLYGQLPREIDITMTMHLLEKERALAGGANFGHAPRDEGWNDIGSPNSLHKNFVVPVTTPFKNLPPTVIPEKTPVPTSMIDKQLLLDDDTLTRLRQKNRTY